MVQEWKSRWGSLANLSFRDAIAFLELGVIKVPVERACEELSTIIKDGDGVLSRLESIAYIDFQSIPAGGFPTLYVEILHVTKHLHEQIAQAKMVLQAYLDMQTRT
jgi:hypothetical protein